MAKKEYSKVYKQGGSKFRYNFTRSVLEYIMIEKGIVEVLDASGLNVDDWNDNPAYWIDQFKYELDEEMHYLMQGM